VYEQVQTPQKQHDVLYKACHVVSKSFKPVFTQYLNATELKQLGAKLVKL